MHEDANPVTEAIGAASKRKRRSYFLPLVYGIYSDERVLATACTTASKTLPRYLSSCTLRSPLASTGNASIEGSDGGIRVYSTLQQETCKGGSLGIYSMLYILDGNAPPWFAIASEGV